MDSTANLLQVGSWAESLQEPGPSTPSLGQQQQYWDRAAGTQSSLLFLVRRTIAYKMILEQRTVGSANTHTSTSSPACHRGSKAPTALSPTLP